MAVKSMGIGAGAGSLGSLVGLGGGFVAIPFLTGWLGLTQVRPAVFLFALGFVPAYAGSACFLFVALGFVPLQARDDTLRTISYISFFASKIPNFRICRPLNFCICGRGKKLEVWKI